MAEEGGERQPPVRSPGYIRIILCRKHVVSVSVRLLNHQFHAGTGDGDVHAAQVAEETDPAFVVGTYEADHDHISLLPLEAIYRVDGYQTADIFE